MTALLDTNILIRHFTGEPSDQARRATWFLRAAQPQELLLLDLIAAEFVFVLQSVYKQSSVQVAAFLRSTLALPAIQCDSQEVLYRSAELYERGMHFADAYLQATAEIRAIPAIVSFDRGVRDIPGVRRLEP